MKVNGSDLPRHATSLRNWRKKHTQKSEKNLARSEGHLREGFIKMFKALREAERARAANPRAAREIALFGYPLENLRREFPEIDFVIPFNSYPKRRGQLTRHYIAWYRWLQRSDEIETICGAGQSAAIRAGAGILPELTQDDLICIKQAFKRIARANSESIERVLTDAPYPFRDKGYHTFMFDILEPHFPEWGAPQYCEFADEACLCESHDSHDLRTLQLHRRERRQAIAHYQQFKTNPSDFVRKYIEEQEQSRLESQALEVARLGNSKIRAATSDKREFLREKKRGWKLEEVVTVSNNRVWLLSPPDFTVEAKQVSDRVISGRAARESADSLKGGGEGRE